MYYFHIDSCYAPAQKKLLEVGQTINTNDRRINPYYEQKCNIHHIIPVDGKNRRLIEFLGSKDVELVPNRPLSDNFRSVLSSYIDLIREMEFENVRLDKFSELPSRTQCIWIIDSFEKAKYWRERLEKAGKTQIVKVEVKGKVITCDGGWLPTESSSLPELRQAAQNYWSGIDHNSLEKEILLEGSMTVVEVMS